MVMDGDNLLGIVTKSDITLKAVAKCMDINAPISNIMTSNVMTIDADKTIFDALEIMVMYNIKNLPVLKDGKGLWYCINYKSVTEFTATGCLSLSGNNKSSSEEKIIELSSQKQEIFQTLVQTNVKPHTIQKL